MRKWVGLVLLASGLLGGCSLEEGSKPDPEKQPETRLADVEGYEILAENLHIPWSITKTGDTFFITERTGTIMKIENGKAERQNVFLKELLSRASEAGLLGFVLDQDFPKKKSAFAYYTYEKSSGQFNRVVILSYQNGSWKEERTLLDRLPSGPVHHGGRMKIGPDGKLYVTAGDAANPENAQDLRTLGGKILRMELDGSIPEDNPFPGSYIYSYGHRNPQGLAWLPDGTMVESEHGQTAHDEINIIKAGGNYGWPVITGLEEKEGMVAPLFQSGNTTWAPSGLAAYGERLYAATLRGNAVREFDPGKKTTREIVSGIGRIRDVLIDGGYLYFISNNTDGRGNPDKKDDKLYRIPLKEVQ